MSWISWRSCGIEEGTAKENSVAMDEEGKSQSCSVLGRLARAMI